MIAVIIPAYNRSYALRRALQSLVQQTESHFITVVVDDASTEELQPICEHFNQWLNVVYLRQPVNGGPGAARMRGISWAIEHNIDFVLFLDSDDNLLPHAVRALKYEITHTNADIISSDIAVEGINSPHYTIPAEESITWFHGKIYRTKFLESLNLSFPADLRTNEDLAFNLICRWVCEKYYYIHQTTYLWRADENSLTRALTPTRDACMGIDYIKAIFTAESYVWEHHPKLIKDLAINFLRQLVCCYNYYQMELAYGRTDTSEMDWRLIAMASHPIVHKVASLTSTWQKFSDNVWQYSCKPATKTTKSQIIFFKQTFYEWYTAHGGVLPEGAI